MKSQNVYRFLCMALLLLLVATTFSGATADPVATKIQGADTLSTPVQVQSMPLGGPNTLQTALTSSATGAASSAVATLAGTSGKTTYITGFEITGGGATGASIVTATVAGTISGTMSYNIAVPAGATAGITPLVVEFATPIPASGQNVSIVVTAPTFGAGNTNSAVAAHGFQQ